MSKLSGTIICKQCGKPINWEYIPPQRINGSLCEVMELSPDKAYAKYVGAADFSVRCKNCDSVNIFLCNME